MKTWFQLSEEEYMEFGASTEATVRMRIARGSFKLQNSFCDSKAKVLCDLAFQALDFSFISNLAYNSLCALLYVLSEELCHILNNHKDIESTPRRRFASSVSNFCTNYPR